MVNKIADIYECPPDRYLLKFIDTHLDIYYKLGFTPNMITTISIIVALFSAYNIFHEKFKLAAILFLFSYYFDCVDGKLARKFNMQTTFGDYYDHFGDLFKIFIILYALYKTNTDRFTDVFIILILLFIGLCIHMGYQETIYNKNESSTLNLFKKLVSSDKTPHKTILYTKYIGCGVFMIVLFIIIFFWKKS